MNKDKCPYCAAEVFSFKEKALLSFTSSKRCPNCGMNIMLGRASLGWAFVAFLVFEYVLPFFHVHDWWWPIQILALLSVIVMYAIGSAKYAKVIPVDE